MHLLGNSNRNKPYISQMFIPKPFFQEIDDHLLKLAREGLHLVSSRKLPQTSFLELIVLGLDSFRDDYVTPLVGDSALRRLFDHHLLFWIALEQGQLISINLGVASNANFLELLMKLPILNAIFFHPAFNAGPRTIKTDLSPQFDDTILRNFPN